MKILLYNVQMPCKVWMSNGQDERTQPLLERLRTCDADVIVMLELFHAPARKRFLEGLASAYPYHCRLPRHRFCFVCGGVMVWSRQPWLKSHVQFYQQAQGSDRLASKGFVHVQLQDGRHLIATHVQAWTEYAATRRLQYDELTEYVQRHIGPQEPLIVLGDLNWDYHTEVQEFEACVGRVQRSVPTLDSHPFASDADYNTLRGNDGTAESGQCGDKYYCEVCWSGGTDTDPGWCARYCPRPTQTTVPSCDCCEKKLLDYAFVPKGYPSAPRLEHRVDKTWKSRKPLSFETWRSGWIGRPRHRTTDLSDHFPVFLEWDINP